MHQRSLSRVPRALYALLLLALMLQLGVRATAAPPTARASELPAPPPAQLLRIGAMGEPLAAGQLLTLYLQSFDTQPGVSIPFRELDYERIALWLERLLSLDADSQYPLLLASQVYAQVPDEARQRRMLGFVFEQFKRDPVPRWRWLAHAALMAKHRLHDLPLALAYAEALAGLAADSGVPSWARQMHIFLLEDLGEIQSARILLGGLLASGTVTDPSEIRFLTQRLEALENADISTHVTKP